MRSMKKFIKHGCLQQQTSTGLLAKDKAERETEQRDGVLLEFRDKVGTNG